MVGWVSRVDIVFEHNVKCCGPSQLMRGSHLSWSSNVASITNTVPPVPTQFRQSDSFRTVVVGMAPTAATVVSARSVLEQQKPLHKSRASHRGWLFRFTQSGRVQHRSLVPEDVRACGFRVPPAERTLPAADGSS